MARSSSQVRQNFPEECEAGINRQINLELVSSYAYQSMAHHFARDDTALPGFHLFLSQLSCDRQDRSDKLKEYQNRRGGRVVLLHVGKPEADVWGSGMNAMKVSLILERNVNQALLDLHNTAQARGDTHLGHLLRNQFLPGQVEIIKQIGDFYTQLGRVGPGLGEYTFDKKSLQQ